VLHFYNLALSNDLFWFLTGIQDGLLNFSWPSAYHICVFEIVPVVSLASVTPIQCGLRVALVGAARDRPVLSLRTAHIHGSSVDFDTWHTDCNTSVCYFNVYRMCSKRFVEYTYKYDIIIVYIFIRSYFLPKPPSRFWEKTWLSWHVLTVQVESTTYLSKVL